MKEITCKNQLSTISGGLTSLDELTDEQLNYCVDFVAHNSFKAMIVCGYISWYFANSYGVGVGLLAALVGGIVAYPVSASLDIKYSPYCNADMGYYD